MQNIKIYSKKYTKEDTYPDKRGSKIYENILSDQIDKKNLKKAKTR